MYLTDDIEPLNLSNELQIVQNILTTGMTPLDAVNYIERNNLFENVPNIIVCLRILLTLPITVASGERSFSKLKIIKNYLRSSMAQQRLINTFIYINHRT